MRRQQQTSRSTGAYTVETAVSMVILIPLLITIVFVGIEACKGIAIMQALEQGARQAAHNLAVAYADHPTIVSNPSEQRTYGFDPVRIHGVIESSAQFDPPTWKNVPGAPGNPTTTIDPASPQTVSVTVSYTSGQNGVPAFPDIDPLHWAPNFNLKATSTYTIE
jgi:hypothetical protein